MKTEGDISVPSTTYLYYIVKTRQQFVEIILDISVMKNFHLKMERLVNNRGERF